ncbi:MAG: ferritin-like domain-containing protein [Planctomycetota bacterium]
MDRNTYLGNLKKAFASQYVFLIKSQNYHWNITGRAFYADHLLLERIYQEVEESIDAFAENLRKVDTFVPAGVVQFGKLSVIKDSAPEPANAAVMLTDLYEDALMMVEVFKQLFVVAEAAGDHGLSNFLADRQDAFAGHAWMLGALRNPPS